VVWFALVTVRESIAFLTAWRSPDDTGALLWVIAGSAVSLVVLLMLWFFPRSIARGLLPISSDTPSQTSSHETWFTLGVTLIGLWFVASSIAPILRNLSVMYVFRSEFINLEDMRQLRAGIFYHVVELVLGLCLVFGAGGIRNFIWWARRAGPG
jgi:hypothetical protein